jgi:hypothetical protein
MAFDRDCVLFEHRGPGEPCSDIWTTQQAKSLFLIAQVAEDSIQG